MSPESVAPENLRSDRKSLVGSVVSAKMDKTRIVEVGWQSTHPRYGKVLRRSTRLYAHDEKNETHTGDKVEIVETRPMSKTKRWRIARVLGKAS